ncbi:MAG: Nre family DNA repair protein [Infirmifilum sp.]
MLKRPNPRICSLCKGSRRLCGLPRCPILTRVEEQLNISPRLSSAISSPTPPSILVGEHGYPSVRVGVNLPVGEGEPHLFENPVEWWGRLDLWDILKLRARLVYSYTRINVKSSSERVVEAIREAAISSKPVESEAVFKRPPVFTLRFDPLLKPMGFAGEASSINVVGNPHVPRRVDNLVEDRVKAGRALVELYKAGYDVYYLQRLLTSGALGVEKRFVPSRWAITAVDKRIGDFLLQRVRDNPEITNHEVYHARYIGNNYTIILIPGAWRMEMIEAWLSGSVWVPTGESQIYSIHEYSDGKASQEDGGYYAIRVALLEHLYQRGRQAQALVVREVTPEYFAPVGNWQIRESVRNALKDRAEEASSLEEALELASRHMILPLEVIYRKSRLLKFLQSQVTLVDFL